MKLLFFGDVVGAIGRQGLAKMLPMLRERHAPDLVIANVENLAHGAGVTSKTLEELKTAGVDVFTGGNHSWGNSLGVPLFEDPAWKDRLFVPTNYALAKNGQAAGIVTVGDTRVLVINLIGQLFINQDNRSPFETLDEILKKYADQHPDVIFVDHHAEATSEKEGLGHYADGRVTAVFGTHTHVPTADAKILPGGTAYVTDVGRCGARDSVVGFDKKTSVERFLRKNAAAYEIPTSGAVDINAMLLSVDPDTKKVTALDHLHEIVDV